MSEARPPGTNPQTEKNSYLTFLLYVVFVAGYE